MSEIGQLDRKKKMLEALEESYGIVTRAAQIAEVPRSTFYEWLSTDLEFKAAVEAVNDIAIDFVESKLFERINGVVVQTGEVDGEPITYKQPPSDTAMIFYLKCKAKKRGYVERTEISGPDGQPIQINNITGMEIK